MPRRLAQPADSRTPFESPAWQGFFTSLYDLFGQGNLGKFVVAALPTGAAEGQQAYATNGRKSGEGAGAGTGVPVYYSNGAWRVFSTDAAVAA